MALKCVVMTLLSKRERSGYEIVQAFDTAVGFFWSASHQQVYRELARLDENNWVAFKEIKQSDKPNKKIYRLSAEGKRELETWLSDPVRVLPTKDLLLVKLLSLSDTNTEVMVSHLEESLGKTTRLRETFREIEQCSYPKSALRKLPLEQLGLFLALRKGISGLNAHFDWLTEALGELQRRQRLGQKS